MDDQKMDLFLKDIIQWNIIYLACVNQGYSLIGKNVKLRNILA